MLHKKPRPVIPVLAGIVLLIFSVINSSSCKNEDDKNTPKPSDTTTPLPDCPPNKITEFYKLELRRDSAEKLIAQATNGGSLVFQFSYTGSATKRVSLIAYAAKPGRNFLPPLARRMATLDVIALALPDTISLGDQYVSINAPGPDLRELIINSGHAGDYYSLTFTPQLSTQNVEIAPGVIVVVTNIKYRICVKVETSPGVFIESCDAAPVETQPSPPAN